MGKAERYEADQGEPLPERTPAAIDCNRESCNDGVFEIGGPCYCCKGKGWREPYDVRRCENYEHPTNWPCATAGWGADEW